MKRTLIAVLFFTFIVSSQIQGQILNVSEVIQEQDQWCWAGVTSCILNYYCIPTTQCAIADYTRNVATFYDFGTTDCCINPNKGCNYWNYLYGSSGSIEDILNHFGNLSNQGLGAALSKANVITNLQQNRLFVIRWGWLLGGGHFVVGHGIVGDNMYYMDPWYGEGKKIATFPWVCADGDHTWTHTEVLTVSPPSGPPEQAGVINGNSEVCNDNNAVFYSVSAIPNTDSYIWTIPDGASGSSNTNSITIVYGALALSGDIKVKGVNTCGEGANSSLSVNVKDCNVHNTYSIKGTINYDNTKFTPLNNIKLKLKTPENNIIKQTTTNIDGNYKFDSIPVGRYSIELTTNKSWRLSTPTDALLTSKYFVGLYVISDDYRKKAADVDASNTINPTDALNISRRFVNISSSFKAGDWLFIGETDVFVTDSDLINDYIGICVGDVKGLYNPSTK